MKLFRVTLDHNNDPNKDDDYDYQTEVLKVIAPWADDAVIKASHYVKCEYGALWTRLVGVIAIEDIDVA